MLSMEGWINSVKSAALNVGQLMMPVLKESKFKETGVLTPEEFVLAGDYLTYHCSTWSWAKAADKSKYDFLLEIFPFLLLLWRKKKAQKSVFSCRSEQKMLININGLFLLQDQKLFTRRQAIFNNAQRPQL